MTRLLMEINQAVWRKTLGSRVPRNFLLMASPVNGLYKLSSEVWIKCFIGFTEQVHGCPS